MTLPMFPISPTSPCLHGPPPGSAPCCASVLSTPQTVRQYRELLDHCSEGLRFYLGMSEVVRKAKQEAADFAFTRQVGRPPVGAAGRGWPGAAGAARAGGRESGRADSGADCAR